MRHRLDVTGFGDPFGFVGQQRGERGERALGLADRLHLEPVAEQHDVDEQRELPPEVEIEAAHVQARREARGERDRDREADQQHHARLPGADLVRGALQERDAAVDEDGDAEQRRDPAGARRARVADEVGEHAREGNDRHRQREAPPEPLAELGRMIRVTGMTGVVRRRGLTVCGLVLHHDSVRPAQVMTNRTRYTRQPDCRARPWSASSRSWYSAASISPAASRWARILRRRHDPSHHCSVRRSHCPATRRGPG